MKKVLFWAAFALVMFVSFDHMMMLDQQRMCERGDTMPCPTGLWIWERL